MEPKANFVQDIALFDPIAALGIVLGIPRLPVSMNVPAIFSSFSINQPPIEAQLDTTIAQRTWIDNITYSLQQPNVFSGNIFKTLYDANLKAQPGISVKIMVTGCRYLVSPQFTPLENVVNMIDSRWVAGWPLFKQQSIRIEYILTQAPPSTSPNGPPYLVTTTFNGWQFADCALEDICRDEAADCLRKMGFFVPDATCVPRRWCVGV